MSKNSIEYNHIKKHPRGVMAFGTKKHADGKSKTVQRFALTLLICVIIRNRLLANVLSTEKASRKCKSQKKVEDSSIGKQKQKIAG